MSYLVEKEQLCPFCEFPGPVEVWSVINVREDPELKDLLLGGEINMVECAACHKVFYAEQFLIYHDPVQEHMAFVYPKTYESDKAQWEQKAQSNFDESQANTEEKDRISYPPTVYFGLNDLVEMVRWEEEAHTQAEIVQHLAGQEEMGIKRLKSAQSRNQKLPPVLPFIAQEGDTIEQSILRALDRILEMNNRLFLYKEATEILKEKSPLEIG